MSTNVLMPQMGESIAEGTIVRWIKQVGDPIDKDEPLFEISTDKVDAEIPSPGAGVVVEIKVKEGETVAVNSVVAVIGEAGTGTTGTAGTTSTTGAVAASVAPGVRARPVAPVAGAVPAVPIVPIAPVVPVAPAVPAAPGVRLRSSPLVRKIARTHGVDIARLTGTGLGGRVTKHDILSFLEKAPAAPAVSRTSPAGPTAPAASIFTSGEATHVEKMGIMRKKIADHMVNSLKTSAHVYSAYEVDFSRVDQLRLLRKADYERAGTKLTYTAFIARATVEAIREFPFANASLDGESIVYKRDVNLGIAVALDQGLIVPVIRNAESRSLLDLCRAIQDLAHRARTKQLKTDEVQGGTFTITNPGIFGGLWGLPIISQPQVAILGVGSVDKRVVVVDDMIAIRPMCYLTLGYDHRLIDGADAGRFLLALKDRLQNFDPAWV